MIYRRLLLSGMDFHFSQPYRHNFYVAPILYIILINTSRCSYYPRSAPKNLSAARNFSEYHWAMGVFHGDVHLFELKFKTRKTWCYGETNLRSSVLHSTTLSALTFMYEQPVTALITFLKFYWLIFLYCGRLNVNEFNWAMIGCQTFKIYFCQDHL